MKCPHIQTQVGSSHNSRSLFSIPFFTLYHIVSTFRCKFYVCVCVCMSVRLCLCPKKTGILMDEYATTWNESVQICMFVFFHLLKLTHKPNVCCLFCLSFGLILFHVLMPLGKCACVSVCVYKCVQVSRCASPNDHRIFLAAATMSLNCNFNALKFV